MENPATELAALLTLWNGHANEKRGVRDHREERSKQEGLTDLQAMERAFTLYAAVVRELEVLRASGLGTEAFDGARAAWVKAIVLPDTQWSQPGTGKTKIITPPELSLLHTLGMLIEQHRSRPTGTTLNFEAVSTLVDEVLAHLDNNSDKIPGHVDSYVRTLIAGVRDALTSLDPFAVINKTMQLLGALTYFGDADDSDAEAPWAEDLRDVAKGGIGSLMANGVNYLASYNVIAIAGAA